MFRPLLLVAVTAAACSPDVTPADEVDAGVNRPDATATSADARCNSTLSGTVTAPNGIDPVPSAIVYVPLPGPIPPFPAQVTCDSCAQAAPGALTSTVTEIDGSFTLSRLPDGVTAVRVVVEKGRFRKVSTVPLSASCAAHTADLRLPSKNAGDDHIPRIAVATGDYDAMECVLQQLGLPLSSFDLYDGVGSDFGDSLADLLKDGRLMKDYNIIFINCARDRFQYLLDDALVRGNIEDYVASGGRLYVTDWAYDYIEQVPELAGRIDFGPTASPGVTPEPMDAAEIGDQVDAVDANIVDDGLAAWLHIVQQRTGDEVIRGNVVRVVDWLGGWAMQLAVPPPGKVWVTGAVHGGPLDATLPLTTTFDYNNCGRVLFSSYHTARNCSTGTDITPQERILEYLILHVADCIRID